MYKYQRLRDLREDKDKKQEDIAEMLNLHLTTYKRWETGITEVPTHIIKELAIYYNITADYIIGIIDEQKPIFTNRK